MTVRETLHNLLPMRLQRVPTREPFTIPSAMDSSALRASALPVHRPLSWGITPSHTTPPPPPPQLPCTDASASPTTTPSPSTPATPLRKRKRITPVYTPRLSSPSSAIRSPDCLPALQLALPARHHRHDWQKVYSTMRDGISLQTLYANCAGVDPIMLVIRDGENHTFGTFTTTPWHPHTSYYGNGETFVFTLAPKPAVYKWSRKNSYFQLSSNDSFALGGGGKFALFVDSMLEHGTSGVCATFGNPCLASKDEFDIVVLEAYKLVPPHKFKMDDDVVDASVC